MKITTILSASCLLAGVANAATIQTISATNSPSLEGWSVNLTSGDGAQNGEFSGDSASNGGGSSGAGAGATAWALYANSDQTAEAVYSLGGGALTVGQAVALDFDNGYVNTGGTVGVTFLNGGTEVLAFTFAGGDPNYAIFDGVTTDSGIGFTADGFNVALNLTASGAYSLNAGGNVFNGTLNNGQTTLDQVRVFNFNAGGGDDFNVFFNNLSVTNVPEPSSTALLGLGGLSLLLHRRRNS